MSNKDILNEYEQMKQHLKKMEKLMEKQGINYDNQSFFGEMNIETDMHWSKR